MSLQGVYRGNRPPESKKGFCPLGMTAWASREARGGDTVDLRPFFTLPAPFLVLTEGFRMGGWRRH